MRYKVLLVEPNQLLRQGLRSLLNAEPDFGVVAEAEDAVSAINAAVTHAPDIVLTEVALTGTGALSGMEAIAEIKRRCQAAIIVVLTSMRTHNHVRGALSLGASAFIVKETSFDQVLTALRSAVRGCTYLSPEVSGLVVRQFLDPTNVDRPKSQLDLLTRRERSILRLIAEGHTNRSAALELHLSPKTVEKHRASLMHKLGLQSVTELAVLAVEAGLIDRPSSVRRAVEGLGVVVTGSG